MGKVQFGKYAGFDLSEVPSSYLDWLIETIEAQLAEYKAERERRIHGSLNMAMKIASVGYRELSKKLHPDKGGDEDDMKSLNKAMDFIRRLAKDFE